MRWTNGGGTTEYFRIAYALGTSVPNCQSGTEVPASTTQFTTPNTLADSSDYTFSVCARYENKFSAAISTLVHTEAKPIPPKAVNLVANVVHDSRIDLSWASGGATTVQFRVGAVAGTSAPAACTVPGSVVVPLSQLSNSFHPLLPDTSYALVVCAINEYGFESAPSFVVAKTPVLTKPPQVSNLVLDSFGDTEAALSWASGGGNTASYKVGYKQGSFATLDCSNATQAQDATSYSVNNLLKDYDYTFVVCALSESGALSDPGILHVHTISPSPAPLNFQSAVVSDSVVRFSWEPGNNVTQSYRIVSKVGKVAPACSGGVALKEPVRSYEWHKLKPGTQYSFSLCAYNVAKIASRPLSVTLTTQALTPPLPLDSFGVQSSTDSSVKLAWTVKAPNGGNLAQFRIVAKAGTVAPACNSGGVLLDKSIRSYEFRALKGVYSFTICGLSEIGTLSVKSDTSVQLAAAYAPPAPTDLHVTSLNDTVVKLAWTSGGDNTVKFRLVNKVGAIAPSCASGGTLLDDEILSYSYPTLKPSTQYTFALCALNGTSPVKISTARTLTVNTLAAAAPPKPQGFAVSRKSDTVIALSWNPVAASGDNTTKFRIVSKAGSVAPSCASGGTLVEETVTSTQFAGLKPGAPYSFTLCGLNGTNLVSPKSDLTESTDALTVPNAPTLPEFDDEASDALSLQWSWKSGLSNTLGYYVAFAAGDLPSLDCRAGSEASVLEVAHPASERVIYRKTTGLAANRAYTISVCAYSASKQVSAPVVIRGGKTQRPPAVDLLQIYGAPTRTSIGIQWVSGGIGTSNYLVSISLGDVAPECGAGGVANVQSTPTYLSKTGLKAGTQYAVSVCGRAANGELSDKESLLIKTDP